MCRNVQLNLRLMIQFMVCSMLSAEVLWESWKRNFTSWLDSHYKLSWEMSAAEWTQGVIQPYLLHLARERLGMWIRFAQEGKSGSLVFDSDASTPAAHIEHENERDGVFERLPAMLNSTPPLKCIVTYGDPKGGVPSVNRAENRELMSSWSESVLGPVLRKLLSQRPAQQWLLIIGLEYDFRGEEDWMAYEYSAAGGKISISELE